MKPKNPGSERVQSRPHYCGTGASPVDGLLEVFLGTGRFIFCRAGVCSTSPLALSMFSTDARSTRPTVPCYRKALRRLPKEL
jgi:hypothetical protein